MIVRYKTCGTRSALARVTQQAKTQLSKSKVLQIRWEKLSEVQSMARLKLLWTNTMFNLQHDSDQKHTDKRKLQRLQDKSDRPRMIQSGTDSHPTESVERPKVDKLTDVRKMGKTGQSLCCRDLTKWTTCHLKMPLHGGLTFPAFLYERF